MRYELTYDEWAVIKPMLPNKPRGVPRVNDRRVLNGIFWVLRSGAPRPLSRLIEEQPIRSHAVGKTTRPYSRLSGGKDAHFDPPNQIEVFNSRRCHRLLRDPTSVPKHGRLFVGPWQLGGACYELRR